jgi:hypothetical protein
MWGNMPMPMTAVYIYEFLSFIHMPKKAHLSLRMNSNAESHRAFNGDKEEL